MVECEAPQASFDSPEEILHEDEICGLYRSHKLDGILEKQATEFVM